MIRSRRGFTLLEVLLATSILMASLVVLGELAALGRRHADDAEQRTMAQLICQAKLDAILAGALPARPVEEAQVEDAPGWLYTVEVEPAGRLGLVSLRVTVSREAESAGGEPLEPAVEVFHLSRWMRDPDRASPGGLERGWERPAPFGESLAPFGDSRTPFGKSEGPFGDDPIGDWLP